MINEDAPTNSVGTGAETALPPSHVVVRTLLEKGGLLEKKERPSIAIGKAKLEKEKLAKAKNKDEENDSKTEIEGNEAGI